MKKNTKVSNKIELIRTLILSIENINPSLSHKLYKDLKEMPELNILYHNIKFKENRDNLILEDINKLLILFKKYRNSNNLKNINQNDKYLKKYKKKNIFYRGKSPLSKNYEHYNYKRYKERLKYYEKKLKPNLNKHYEKEKILFTTLKGLVLIEFL